MLSLAKLASTGSDITFEQLCQKMDAVDYADAPLPTPILGEFVGDISGSLIA